MHDSPKRPLPGDRSLPEEIERMIRVDHAGEYGAMRIYAGQMAVLRDPQARRLVAHMMEQERGHLAHFDTMLAERRVRPTALMPLWHAAGFLLGAATAAIGPKAAMACTAAVEEVIDRHYADQHERLGDHDPALSETIDRFRREELEHRDTALEHGAPEAPLSPLLQAGIRQATRLAIWLSTRV